MQRRRHAVGSQGQWSDSPKAAAPPLLRGPREWRMGKPFNVYSFPAIIRVNLLCFNPVSASFLSHRARCISGCQRDRSAFYQPYRFRIMAGNLYLSFKGPVHPDPARNKFDSSIQCADNLCAAVLSSTPVSWPPARSRHKVSVEKKGILRSKQREKRSKGVSDHLFVPPSNICVLTHHALLCHTIHDRQARRSTVCR